MKVIHFGSGNLFGGIEVLLVTMAKYQKMCQNLDQGFAFFFEGKIANKLRGLGFEVKVFPETRIRYFLKVSRVRLEIEKYLEKENPDTVIVHSQWVNFIVAKVCRKKGIKLISWIHDPPEGKRLINWVLDCHKPNKYIFNSKFTKNACKSLTNTVPGKVIYSPVEPLLAKTNENLTTEFRVKWGANKNDLVFLHVARWEPHKGHIFLVNGARKLQDLKGNWKIWFVGDAQRTIEKKYRDQVKKYVEKLGLENKVNFLGWQENLDLILACSDVYCQPNIRHEPLGVSIIEAMYAGLPVITTPLGGPKETVDDTCGIHVEPNDDSALSVAMEKMFDRNYRESLGKGGMLRANKISCPDVQLASFYEFLSIE